MRVEDIEKAVGEGPEEEEDGDYPGFISRMLRIVNSDAACLGHWGSTTAS